MRKMLTLVLVMLSLNSFAGTGDTGSADAQCLSVYQEAVVTTETYLESRTVGKQLIDYGPGLVSKAWKEGYPISSVLFGIMTPILSPFAATIEQINYVMPKRKNLQVYKSLVKILSNKADEANEEEIGQLKDHLGLENVSNNDFVLSLRSLNDSGELCYLKSPILSLSPKGMTEIKARGYTGATQALLSGIGNDKDWWGRFQKDSSNFEETFRGALTTEEITHLINASLINTSARSE